LRSLFFSRTLCCRCSDCCCEGPAGPAGGREGRHHTGHTVHRPGKCGSICATADVLPHRAPAACVAGKGKLCSSLLTDCHWLCADCVALLCWRCWRPCRWLMCLSSLPQLSQTAHRPASHS
jgi:hypothetical protein